MSFVYSLIYLVNKIIHVIRCADHAAVPVRNSGAKNGKYGWSRNPILVSACSQAREWLRIWQECDRLRVGLVKAAHIYMKRKSVKCTVIMLPISKLN